MKLNLKWKTLMVTMVLLIVPVSVIGWFGYQTSKKETDKLYHTNLVNSVHMASEIIHSLSVKVDAGVLSMEEAQEQAKSLLLGPKKEDGTRPINPHIDLGENGYFYVLNEKGDLLAHPSLEGTNLWEKKTSDGFYYIQDVIKQAKNGGGFTEYIWPLPNSEEEATKMVYAEYIDSWNWVISAGSYLQDYNGGQQTILRTLLITLVSCILIGGAVSYWFARHLSIPVQAVTRQARQIASGDLSGEALQCKNRDEIGELTEYFNSMQDTLKSLVREITRGADQLNSSSTTLANGVQDTLQSARHITESVQQIAAGMEKQTSDMEMCTKSMEDMTGGILTLAETSGTAFEASILMETEAKRGQELMKQSVVSMDYMTNSVRDLSDFMKRLNVHSDEISEIIQVMTGIANQTSLLALNASIEAARAGENGKGFAVVASEVKKLSEHSMRAAKDVVEKIEVIQKDISTATQMMQSGVEAVSEGESSIRAVEKVLEEIIQASRQVLSQIEEASAVSQQMSASSEQVLATVQTTEQISFESSSATQNISAAAEEQFALIEEVHSASITVKELASKLEEKAKTFKLPLE